ncbi:MAG TPA: DUF1800 family protein [Bryobacteraceae bacterium]
MTTPRIALQLLAVTSLMVTNALAQQITVYSNDSVAIGQTRQMTAYVPLAVTTVTWSVNGTVGGNSTYGTVSTSGLYTAPMAVPMNNAVTVQATSTADATKFGTATITVTQPPVNLWSTSPTSVPVGTFTISLNGSNFGANSTVMFGSAALATTLVSSTGLKATGTATVAQVGTKVPVKVVNSGLGGTTSGVVNLSVTAAAPVTVSVLPSSAGVPVSTVKQFSASVSGSTNTSVTWSVNAVTGGNSTVGTISSSGLYAAPTAVPSPATVTVTATSVASPSSAGSATVTVQPPAPPPVTVTVSPSPVTVAPSASQPFTATVTNSTNTAVTWGVNGTPGGSAALGTITSAGVYTAPAVPPNPATVTVQATSVASSSSVGSAAVSIVGPPNPGPGLGTRNLSAGRFLEQAAFGPTTADIKHLQQIGNSAWITEQFNMPETAVIDPGGMNTGLLQSQYLSRLAAAPDQLRQRVAYALSQIIVISMNKNIYPDEVVPYLQILSKDAFGNYRTLLGDITVSSPMGKYLDLARSTKPTSTGGANENYARESMQLFSIGLYMLNQDGSRQLDGLGNPIPTYNQTTVQQVARALTGWIYLNNAWEDFTAPMQPLDANHDMTQKSFLGCTLAANQTTVQDTNGYLDCLFNHPNVGPFLATRLIRSMVTSNPSPGYISRVAAAFNNNGSGVRGDMRAVITAILTDAEARNDTAQVTAGRLKDAIYHAIAFTRALNGSISPTNGLTWEFTQMGQTPLMEPSVFSFFSPSYKIPTSTLFGPEFQIYTPTECILRGNFFWQMISNPATDFTIDYTSYLAAAGNTQNLIDAVDQALLYGRMPQTMRQTLANIIVQQPDNPSRMQIALYLTALSGFYAVQY